MAKLEFIDPEGEDYFNILVQVGFENPLEARDVIQVLQIVVETITSKIGVHLVDGLDTLKIDTTSLTICFRSLRANHDPNPYPGEELSRLKVQFIFYLFAKIDLQCRLADIPFPPDFREFISLPDYL